MKIIIISKSSWNIFNFRKSLIQKLILENHEIIILSNYDSYTLKLENLGCKFFKLDIQNRSLNFFNSLFILIKLIKYILIIKPKIILSFNIKPVIFSGLVSKFYNIINIGMITGMGTAFESKNFIKIIATFLYKISISKRSIILCQNKNDFEFFYNNTKIKKDNILLTPGSGVNLNYFKNNDYIPKKWPNFIFASRLLWSKGIKEFCEAAKILKIKYPLVNFIIYGSFEEQNNSEVQPEYINKFVKKNLIIYNSFSDNIIDILKQADCIILPSYREGKPKILLEAMSMGVPIVTTNSIGCSDIILDNQNGFICKRKDTYSLSQAIEKFILLDSDKKKSMSTFARKFIEQNYNEEKVINIYKKILKKIEKN